MNLSSLNPFDWLLIAILAWSTVRAFLRGFLIEVFSLGGLIAGILLAGLYYPRVAGVLSPWITSLPIARVVAFLLIVVGIMVLSALCGRLLKLTARTIGLGLPDRLLGAAFGAVRGCLLGVAVVMAIAAFLPQSQWIRNSQLTSCFLAGAHAVSFVVPHDLQQQILNGVAQFKHNAPDWIKQRQ